MTATPQFDKDPMTDAATTSNNALPDNASDYGDFGSDTEEIEILNLLLAQVEKGVTGEDAPPLLVNDIEDYEQPEGIFLPKRDSDQLSPRPQTEPDSQVLRDHLEVEIGASILEIAMMILTH